MPRLFRRAQTGLIASTTQPFEIYDASTASYGKKVSSTYQRYACGTFLPYSLYLHRLFQKAYGKSVQKRHGCRWFQAGARFGLCTNLDVEQCTRKYTAQQAIFKSVGGAERPRMGVVPNSSDFQKRWLCKTAKRFNSGRIVSLFCENIWKII